MIGLSLMLLTILLGIGGVLALLAALVLRRPRIALGILGFGVVWAAGYGALLVTTSLASHGRILALGEAKSFCGPYLDCHLHARVTRARVAATVGVPGHERRARGRFMVVQLRIESDARRVALAPESLQALIVDPRGREFPRDPAAERALLGGDLPALEQTIGPGQYYERTLVFDLPAEVREPRLWVSEGHPIQRFAELFLIGDEDSVLHRAVLFRLEPVAPV